MCPRRRSAAVVEPPCYYCWTDLALQCLRRPLRRGLSCLVVAAAVVADIAAAVAAVGGTDIATALEAAAAAAGSHHTAVVGEGLGRRHHRTC